MFSAIISFLSANFLYFILHISNTSCFPKPLKKKEEEEALERLARGDKNARALLIERNLRLVSHIVKKYYSKTNDTEDLISIGTIGLIKAIDSFKPDKGIRLATYASRCIENEILMHFRNIKKNASDVYLGDSLESDRDMAEDLEKKIRWEKAAEYLENLEDEREREIIILRYGLDNKKPLTQREVAARLNISRSYVSRIEKKVLSDMRKNIE